MAWSAAALAWVGTLFAVALWDWLSTFVNGIPQVAPFDPWRFPDSIRPFVQVGLPPLALGVGFLVGHLFWH